MRIGETWMLKWIDVFEKRRIISCRPAKHGNPRIFKVSDKLISMLKRLPKTSEFLFGGSCLSSHGGSFRKQRKRLAEKLKNPRLLKIRFHAFRHWKATMEYHKTKDPWHVKKMLGHRHLKSIEVYVNLEQAIFQTETDEFHVKVAEDPEEIKALLEVGFEYVCQKDGLMFFRKRK